MNRDRVDAVLRAPIESGEIPFVSAVAVDRDGVSYAGAFGDARPGEAMQVASVVRIASMTKALTLSLRGATRRTWSAVA